MKESTSRRGFVAGLAATMSAGAVSMESRAEAASGIRLGVASYSFREFSRRMCIEMTKQLGTRYLCIKEFHALYRSTPEELDKARGEFAKAGIQLTGGGTVYMLKDDDADIRFYFEYAKRMGLPMMVIGPTVETLPRIEKFVKEYGIQVAVHNHGPEDKHFPAPSDALKVMRDMDPRVGVCIDVGHTTRTGKHLFAEMEMAGPRLLDVHIKDLSDLMNKDAQTDVGDGVMPIPRIFRTLKKLNYKGVVHLEYEINGDAPMAGMQRSFSYMRGVLAGMAA